MKYKRLFFSLLSITLLCITNISYGFHVILLFSNHSNKTVKTEGSLTYQEKDGELLWNQALHPPITLVKPKSNNIPQDKETRDYSTYSLEYFDVLDSNGRWLASCMEEYYGVSEGSRIQIDFYPVPGKKDKYYCRRTSQHL